MLYFNQVLESLSLTTDMVLIYEYATCIHEMLKEIDYWLKMNSSQAVPQFGNPFGAHGGLRKTDVNDLLNFSDTGNDAQDDQISMSMNIHLH